ncbi:hypothetical protein MJK71_03500 [Escherichia coli]|nr:hypothetical protein MJK71_03500 [Escherichia coli]
MLATISTTQENK